jgi:sec-independent protein translocase protein TatC
VAEAEHDKKMPFLAHLAELRQRLLWAFASIGVGFALTFSFSDRILAWLRRPLDTQVDIRWRQFPFFFTVPRDPKFELIQTAPAEAFWAHMKVAFFAGLLLSLPVVLYQVWAFIEPGLLPKEKRFALPFVVLSTISFGIGMAFCAYFVLPFALNFLLTFDPNIRPMLSVGNFIDFNVKFLLAFGLVFELPLGIAIAARLGLVTPAFLARNRKYAILFAFIVAAILTPTPDIFNQTLMAGPIVLLYEVGILVARVVARRRKKLLEEAAAEAS